MSLKVIGYINNTHGLRGDLKVMSRTNLPRERFFAGAKIYIGDTECTIERVNFVKEDQLIVHLVSFNDINDVLRFKGKSINFDVVLEEDSIFYEDLIGYELVSHVGLSIGKVDDISIIQDRVYLIVNSKYILYKIPELVFKVEGEKIFLTLLGEEQL